MQDYTRAMLTVAALVQTLYVFGWLTVKWWRWGLGRATFFMAAAFAAILDVLVFGWWFFVPAAAWAFLSTFLALGVIIQFAVFVRERWFADY